MRVYIYIYMDVSKNKGGSPQIIHFNRVFHDFHHPFWGSPIFGNTHICINPENALQYHQMFQKLQYLRVHPPTSTITDTERQKRLFNQRFGMDAWIYWIPALYTYLIILCLCAYHWYLFIPKSSRFFRWQHINVCVIFWCFVKKADLLQTSPPFWPRSLRKIWTKQRSCRSPHRWVFQQPGRHGSGHSASLEKCFETFSDISMKFRTFCRSV